MRLLILFDVSFQPFAKILAGAKVETLAQRNDVSILIPEYGGCILQAGCMSPRIRCVCKACNDSLTKSLYAGLCRISAGYDVINHYGHLALWQTAFHGNSHLR